MKKLKRLFSALIGGVIFTAIYKVVSFLLSFFPSMDLWKDCYHEVTILNHNFDVFTLIHFLVGLVFFVHGSVRLVEITEEVNRVRDKKTRMPNEILTDGYYSKVRHPMYGTFMILQLGIGFATKSLIGTIIVILMTIMSILNGISEEKMSLIPMFKEKYLSYMKKVKHRYLTDVMVGYFVLATFITALGVFYS
ncbi:MAG: hypothetical protein E7214_13225 [Clostridium sp.]|nr:hypothetical protein [Clostridium sp.]